MSNISPRQINRAPLFDIKLNDDNDYSIIVFSDYVAEIEMVPKITDTRVVEGIVEKRRCVRCVLKKGHYKFKVKVVAEEAIPIEGELLVDEWNLCFINPTREGLNIKERLITKKV
ncbi:MAG: hypothetical protein QXO33_06645 [Nitrososphaeria archaeon]